jgi:hypothetical protein
MVLQRFVTENLKELKFMNSWEVKVDGIPCCVVKK